MRFLLLILALSSFTIADELPVQEQRMGYKESVPWEKRDGRGYDGYYRVAVKQDPSKEAKTAEWTVDLPQTRRNYSVFATWVENKSNTRNATYAIFDGEKGLGQITVNQQQPPRGTVIKNTRFQKLGSFRFTSRLIRIVLSSSSDGNVVSDSVLVNPE